MAITWRNINSNPGAVSGAAQLMESAGESVNGAFGAINGLLQNQQKINAANTEQTRVNNTQAFMDQLARYRTPEALRAAQESGEIDTLRQSFGALIDRSATGREAIRQRYEGLRKDRLDQIKYQDTVRQNEERGSVNTFMSLLASNRYDEAEAFLGANPLMNSGELAAKLKASRVATENQEYLQTQRAQAIDSYQEEEAVEAAWAKLRETMGSRSDVYDQRTTDALTKAKEVGLPIKNGKIDYSQATEEQLQALQPYLKDTPLSDTQFASRALSDILDSNKELPPQEEQRMRTWLQETLTNRGQLAASDQARIETQQQKLDLEKNITTNPYYRPERATDVSAAELVKGIPGLAEMSQDFKEDLIPEINRLMEGGEVKVNGETYKVTPELVEMALQFTEEDKWFSWDTNLEDALGKVLENQNMAEKYVDYLDWKTRRQSLQDTGKAAMGNGPSLQELTSAFRAKMDQARK